MLRNASAIRGYAIAASDGRIGTVSDFLFDDESWLVRWLVVDTGHWLPGRKLLLPPSVLGHPDEEAEEFPVRLTMLQVKSSPDIDTDLPVSRRMESHVYDYYGWSPYWSTGLYMGGYGAMGGPMSVSPYMGSMMPRKEQHADTRRSDGDQHLRSIQAITGYHLHASDGEIGHVEDFILEDADWSIHYLVIDTKNWWPGKKVLISPLSVRDIDWSDRLVNVGADRQKVQGSPRYDAYVTVDRAYEKNFHEYYGNLPQHDR